jgi:hypothetical protein
MSAAPTDSAASDAGNPARRGRTVGEAVADAMPGWMFLLSGLALFAVVVLTPPWLAHQQQAWRLQVMQAQADALSRQTERYEAFANALAEDDAVVLERLAMTHLRLGVAGKRPLWVRPVEQETGDVGAWLSVAQPVVGRDVPVLVATSNRLTRIATGPGRPALLVVSLLCIVSGVLFNPRSDRVAAPAPRPLPLRNAPRPALGRGRAQPA